MGCLRHPQSFAVWRAGAGMRADWRAEECFGDPIRPVRAVRMPRDWLPMHNQYREYGITPWKRYRNTQYR